MAEEKNEPVPQTSPVRASLLSRVRGALHGPVLIGGDAGNDVLIGLPYLPDAEVRCRRDNHRCW